MVERPDGTFGVFDGRYNFEMHDSYSPVGVARNVGTMLGDPGVGTSYDIQYNANHCCPVK